MARRGWYYISTVTDDNKRYEMKKLILIAAIGITAACNEPLTVTGKTDPQATTSGTMGSVKANNQMPTVDTPNARRRVDTVRKQ